MMHLPELGPPAVCPSPFASALAETPRPAIRLLVEVAVFPGICLIRVEVRL